MKIKPSPFMVAALVAVSLAGCQKKAAEDSAPTQSPVTSDTMPAPPPIAAPPVETATPAADEWQASASGEGDSLQFASKESGARILLFCAAGSEKLLVNMSDFKPVSSEERMTIGSGGTVATLVAASAGDKLRGGVSGEAAIPRDLGKILGGGAGVSVNYGKQNAGPFPAIPGEMAARFEEGCYD